MWIQAGFSPEPFWDQTPRHFQLAMEGVRKRLLRDGEADLRLAWHTGGFSASASVGKLKPLRTYLAGNKAQTPAEMLAVLRSFQAKGAKMTITRIRLDAAAAQSTDGRRVSPRS